MPIYDYRCNGCGSVYDVLHKVREVAEDIVCPSCGSMEHTRLISAPSIKVGSGPTRNDAREPSCADGICCGGSCGLN